MLKIRLMGEEKEVIEAIQALEDAQIVTNVSGIYANRGNNNNVRVYAEENYPFRLSEVLRQINR